MPSLGKRISIVNRGVRRSRRSFLVRKVFCFQRWVLRSHLIEVIKVTEPQRLTVRLGASADYRFRSRLTGGRKQVTRSLPAGHARVRDQRTRIAGDSVWSSGRLPRRPGLIRSASVSVRRAPAGRTRFRWLTDPLTCMPLLRGTAARRRSATEPNQSNALPSR